MLRLLLGTSFLLSSSFPALAEWSCSYCRGGSGATRYDRLPAFSDPPLPPSASLEGLSSVMAVSVIYPGIIVLMTMIAYYFMRVMEPQAHAHPAFLRSTVSLSALWLLGFYPFLSSALGGFLFCVTALACTGAWVLIHRFNVVKYWERWLVFWAFFFFSLVVGVIVTGNGGQLGAQFEDTWKTGLNSTYYAGPLQLLLANIIAVAIICHVAGWKPQPLQETSRGTKTLLAIVATVIMNIAALSSNLHLLSWTSSLMMMALPSLAYYGLYVLVKNLPEDLRNRAGVPIFAGLAIFIAVLSALAGGVSAQLMLMAGLALGFVAATVKGLRLLWRSQEAVAVKQALTALAATITLGMAGIAFVISWLSPVVKMAFICDKLVPALLGWHTLLLMIVATAQCSRFILSRQYSARAKYTLAAIMALFLLLCHACGYYITPIANGDWIQKPA